MTGARSLAAVTNDPERGGFRTPLSTIAWWFRERSRLRVFAVWSVTIGVALALVGIAVLATGCHPEGVNYEEPCNTGTATFLLVVGVVSLVCGVIAFTAHVMALRRNASERDTGPVKGI